MSDLQNFGNHQPNPGALSDSLKDPRYLAERYVSGTITDDELSLFLLLLEKDKNYVQYIRKNLIVDYLLYEKYNLADSLQKVEEEKIREDLNHPEDLNKILDDLVAYEKTAIPYPAPLRPKEEEEITQRRFIFWGKRIPYRSRSIERDQKVKKGSNIPFILSFTLLIVLCAGLTIDHYLDQRKRRIAPFTGIARIEEVINPVWKPGSDVYKRGQYLETNKLDLLSGIVKIQFKNESRLILEGPTECVINGSKSVYCNQGLLSAAISKNDEGFKVITPFATFIDRGTEFAVNVEKKETRLDMIKGSVDISCSSKQPPVNITAGSTVNVDLSRKLEIKPCRDTKYMSAADFHLRLDHWVQKKMDEENTKISQISNDPALLVYLDFKNGIRHRIPNLSEQGRSLFKEARITGCTTDQGRYHTTKSIRFRNRQDLISLNLFGSWRNFTMITTVRLDSLRPNGNVLFADNHYVSEPSTFLWQILNDGRIRFQLHGKSSDISGSQLKYYDSPVAFTSHQLGTWSQLAVVVNSDQKSISHYLDGKLIGSSPWTKIQDLKVSGATLGNVQDHERGVASRYFGGTMEDFYFYNRALTADELKNINKL